MPTYIVSWNSFAEKLGLPPEWYKEKLNKVFSTLTPELLKHLEAYMQRKVSGPKKTAKIPVCDPDFAKQATPMLHSIFKAFAPKEAGMSMAMLIGVYASRLDSTDLPYLSEQLRAFVKLNPETFSASGGPNPTVVRLKDSKGNPTGAVPFAPKKPGRRSKKNGVSDAPVAENGAVAPS